jgi:ADP-ribose pyrophosphatase YjhB (NUDIX family)
MYHASLARWVPPGGRIDVARGELPHEAAVRKTAQETGLQITLLALNTDVTVDDEFATSIPQPLLTQAIDRGTETYLDFAFVGAAATIDVSLNYERARAFHWFASEDLARFPVARHVAVHARRAIDLVQQREHRPLPQVATS